MNIWLTIRIALRALAKNKLRAGLTVLGVVIGIAAVTAMVSVGESATKLVRDQLESLGTNMIVILPGRASRGGVRTSSVPTLTADDCEAIGEQCPSVLAVSPIVATRAQVIFGNNNWSPKESFGVGVDYLLVRKWQMARGSFFTERDILSASKVCVVGHTVIAELFQTTNPIGETIRVKNVPFRVIGVLEAKGANMVGDDQDDVLLMPYTTVRKRVQGSGFNDVHAIMVSARADNLTFQAEREVRELLLDRHDIRDRSDPDFRIQNTTEIANVLLVITGTLTMMLASIAGISLVVGGVGIMNIMLVSVTERTREIGIRMAVGARPQDILRQFLFEAIVLSCIGGLIGFILGVGGSIGMTHAINQMTIGTKWPIIISIPAAVLAFGFAAAVGIFFGFYPARRASLLDPIDALRYE